MNTYNPKNPVPQNGRVQNIGVTLHQAQEIFAANVELSALSGLIQSAGALVEAEAGHMEDGQLGMKFSLFADKNPTCEFKYAGNLSQDFLARVHQSLRKLPALKSKRDPLSFQVIFKVNKTPHGAH